MRILDHIPEMKRALLAIPRHDCCSMVVYTCNLSIIKIHVHAHRRSNCSAARDCRNRQTSPNSAHPAASKGSTLRHTPSVPSFATACATRIGWADVDDPKRGKYGHLASVGPPRLLASVRRPQDRYWSPSWPRKLQYTQWATFPDSHDQPREPKPIQ